MNYDEALEYLYKIPKFSKKTTKENTVRILDLLGKPQEGIKFFHVAGSNGKGSVCAFLNSILIDAGFHTGLFTSPHLIKANERIKIDGIQVSDSEFLWAFTEVYNVIKENEKYGIVHPSFFEYIFLMSLIVFRKNNVKWGVIEVGLGGRLDATNAINNTLVSVITSISLEHTEILGDTIEKIAWEKAGIIKENTPVVFDGTEKTAECVIKKRAEEMSSAAYAVCPENIKIIKKQDKYIDFSLNTVYYDNDILRVAFPAPYQAMNAALACVAVETAKTGWDDLKVISRENIRRGIENAVWEGRMESVDKNIYIDGAHNVSGTEKFLEAVKDIKVTGNRYLLFSVVKEKDYGQMISMLTEGNIWKRIYITGIQTDRAAGADNIKAEFEKRGVSDVVMFKDSGEAYDLAVRSMEDDDVLFCAGSLYLAGEIKKHIGKEEKYD